MNAVQLLGWITGALLPQLAVGIVVVVRRSRLAVPPTPPAPDTARPRPGLAWEGWREFRIARRHVEDAARTQSVRGNAMCGCMGLPLTLSVLSRLLNLRPPHAADWALAAAVLAVSAVAAALVAARLNRQPR